jgi:hypothetical protein
LVIRQDSLSIYLGKYGLGGGAMQFTYTEAYGDKRITDWLSVKVKEYVKEKHGLEIIIAMKPKLEWDAVHSQTPEK